jgi:glucose-1-phosphatase
MKEKQIRCIFFDLGKVLIDLDYDQFLERMFFLTGSGIEKLRAAFAADGAVSKYELGSISDDEFLAEISQKIGMSLDLKDFLEAWTCLFPEKAILSDTILFELSGNCPLWIISNTNRLHFEYIQERYNLVANYFQGWTLSYEEGFAKPNPVIYKRALQKAGVPAAEALFIDDRQENVESALKLGMDAFQFLNPARLVQELHKRGLLSSGDSEYYR